MDIASLIITKVLQPNPGRMFIYTVCWLSSHSYLLLDHAVGPVGKRFRSKAEFIPHATWLMNGMTGNCECKYCSKRTQKEITAEMGAAGIIPVSMSPTPQGVKR